MVTETQAAALLPRSRFRTPPPPPVAQPVPVPSRMRRQRLTLTPIQWRDRCRQLAEERHLTGTAKMVGNLPSVRGAELYLVPSTSSSEPHKVWHNLHNGVLFCDCQASAYHGPCAHVGAVLHALDMREQALLAAAEAQASEAWRTWLNGMEWA